MTFRKSMIFVVVDESARVLALVVKIEDDP